MNIGPYEVLDKLAAGSMAEVYLAVQRGPEGFERQVVLKRLRPELAADEERRLMFLDEARLMAQLRHPHIAQVFELIEHEDGPYLAMEYVPGVTVAEVLEAARARGTGIPQPEAVGIALGVAEALAYLHSRRDELGEPLQAVHRDVNPANVVLSEEGEIKLIDFGIARASSKLHVTRTGVIMGTRGYMAPEQMLGAPVDARADVYALGVMLYELCTGQHPFGVGPDAETRALRGDLARPATLAPHLHPRVDLLIVQCLARDPSRRPESARAVANTLTSCLPLDGVWPSMPRLATFVRALHQPHPPTFPGGQAPRKPPDPRFPGGQAPRKPPSAAARRLPRMLAWRGAAAVLAAVVGYWLGRGFVYLLS